MLGMKMPGDQAGVFGFVIWPIAGEANGEGLDFGRGSYRHRSDQAGIHPATQQDANRHIGHQLPAHCILEQRFQLIQQRGLVHRAGGLEFWQCPVAPDPRLTLVQVEKKRMGWRQFVDALQNAALPRHIAHRQIAIQGFPVDAPGQGGIGQQAFQFGGKT